MLGEHKAGFRRELGSWQGFWKGEGGDFPIILCWPEYHIRHPFFPRRKGSPLLSHCGVVHVHTSLHFPGRPDPTPGESVKRSQDTAHFFEVGAVVDGRTARLKYSNFCGKQIIAVRQYQVALERWETNLMVK